MVDQKQREKCLKEVKLMQQLVHPNIILFLDNFIFENELLIVTEWAEKGDLKKLIQQAVENEVWFPETVIWDYMSQIAEYPFLAFFILKTT